MAHLLRFGYIMLQRRFPDSTSVTEEILAEAEVRLYQAKLDALLGRAYDPDDYDRRVHTYREAKQRADAARVAALQLAASGYGGPSILRLAA
ncbi:MAG TPA: hypothetical protein VFX49_22740 [Chloroflexota bacterium]|nr:hypothetical protein [Chloroflexota bacterium]